jgi:fructosamine-3-kinase
MEPRMTSPADAQPMTTAVLDPALATTLVRQYVDAALTVQRTDPLPGGHVSHVAAWTLDGPPGQIVAKGGPPAKAAALAHERDSLWFYQRQQALPVPEPLALITDAPAVEGALLLMHRLPGRPLNEARLSTLGRQRLQHALADHLIQLHVHQAERFGVVGQGDGQSRWLDVFGPMLERDWAAVRSRLASRVRPIGDRVLRELDHWLAGHGPPALVHGDLWRSNIIVDDGHPDQPRITGFIDSIARYLDREYEWAYLRLFATADERCFQRYQQMLPLPAGYERRFHLYWLHTMLVHLQAFGERYRPMCEQAATRLAHWH